jgi:hypothetical protein
MHTLGDMAKALNRPAVVLSGIQNPFEFSASSPSFFQASDFRFAPSPAGQADCAPHLHAAAEA